MTLLCDNIQIGGLFMGKGFRGICNKCGKEELFFLGCGMMSLDGKERVLFVCPECGTWKLSLIKEDNNKKYNCKNCNKVMKKLTWKKLDTACELDSEYELTFEKLPYLKKLKCKNCDGLLEIQKGMILWD